MAESRPVSFNLYNVHYAVLTETVGTGGAVTYSYGTPVALPGAVTLTLDQSGDSNVFYADGIAYYIGSANNGYEGDIEVAFVPDTMLVDVFGMTLDPISNVVTETANVEPKPVALMFRVDTKDKPIDVVLYNCKLGRPGIGSTTNTNTKEPQTKTMSISATPRGDYKIKAHTTETTSDTIRNGWYTTVYEEAPAAGADITAFIINGVAGEIVGNNITVNLPHGTAVSSLSPTIALSAGATVSPASGTSKSFTSPQTYTVTAADTTTTKTYTVTVVVAAE